MTDPERRFPVIQTWGRDDTGAMCSLGPRSVPWEVIGPHRKQAERNHCGQTLEELASRGGLSPMELWCAVHGEPLDPITIGQVTEKSAIAWLEETLVSIGEGAP